MKKSIPLIDLPSISEYDSTNPDAPSITWDVELPPHVDQERLLFNVPHMRRMQRVGYFSVNHFASFQGDAAQYDPTVVGIDDNGTALAGNKVSITKTADETKNSLEIKADKHLAISYFKVAASHDLNRTELSQVVTDRLQRRAFGEQSTEKIWAETLNRASNEAILDSARNNLLKRTFLTQRLSDLGLYTWMIEQDITTSTSPEELLLQLGGSVLLRAGVFAGIDSLVNKARYGNSYIKERRLSSFQTMQPEAFVALSALSSVSSLIRYRK